MFGFIHSDAFLPVAWTVYDSATNILFHKKQERQAKAEATGSQNGSKREAC